MAQQQAGLLQSPGTLSSSSQPGSGSSAASATVLQRDLQERRSRHSPPLMRIGASVFPLLEARGQRRRIETRSDLCVCRARMPTRIDGGGAKLKLCSPCSTVIVPRRRLAASSSRTRAACSGPIAVRLETVIRSSRRAIRRASLASRRAILLAAFPLFPGPTPLTLAHCGASVGCRRHCNTSMLGFLLLMSTVYIVQCLRQGEGALW